MKKIAQLMFCFMLIVCFKAYSQDDLSSLLAMKGTWKGEGYIYKQDGAKIEFTQIEEVSTMLSDKLLQFHGMGTGKKSGNLDFEAIGIVYYDQQDKEYYINAWTNDGKYSRASFTPTDTGYTWQIDISNGSKVIYTAEITSTTWKESGKYSPDGTQWHSFMSMELMKE